METDITQLPDNPYILLTPGPLSTTKSVRASMLRDWCTWDDDYNAIVQKMRHELVSLATESPGYTVVPMQGSGTFSVEATITTMMPKDGKLLVLTNGAYGHRMAVIAGRCGIPYMTADSGELAPPDLNELQRILAKDTTITHVAVVHCETTTGMLNPVEAIGKIVKASGRVYMVDAMSSFGGIPMDVKQMGADYLVSSANKCIQGVPGFGFVIAKKVMLAQTGGRARSLSLDLFDQWQTMEMKGGKWRFTSPTHVVRAFSQAIQELKEEGGVKARHQRYRKNQELLTHGMIELGFTPLLSPELQSPIITAFHTPNKEKYNFRNFYTALKSSGFVIYPGKVTDHETFRIGTIGDVTPDDIKKLLHAIQAIVKDW